MSGSTELHCLVNSLSRFQLRALTRTIRVNANSACIIRHEDNRRKSRIEDVVNDGVQLEGDGESIELPKRLKPYSIESEPDTEFTSSVTELRYESDSH